MSALRSVSRAAPSPWRQIQYSVGRSGLGRPKTTVRPLSATPPRLPKIGLGSEIWIVISSRCSSTSGGPRGEVPPIIGAVGQVLGNNEWRLVVPEAGYGDIDALDRLAAATPTRRSLEGDAVAVGRNLRGLPATWEVQWLDRPRGSV